ncbi:hypothetical protein K438DRAFT_1905210 [Mycena galopus ATCC 62051]|nr:hypothetical protein K438DRAFT_1905210 [Mycena galopus ATCC 62051]
MVDAGCARRKVGTLMEQVGEIFGVHINRVMSRRTVGRAILEGGIAAKMQITYELGLNQGISISADSTSNRGINIESAHIALRAPDYKGGNVNIDTSSTLKIRSLGVDKTKDHTSAESVKAWQSRIEEVMDLFNQSPLAALLQKRYTFRHFLKVLKAMNGDHASTEKGTANGLREMKHIEAVKELGEDALVGKAFMDLVHFLAAWNAKKIARLGGIGVWDALSEGQKAEEDKDGNSFGGGNTEIILEWPKIGVPSPILLANKQNAAILPFTRGGVKTCALAGAIFNNKDDKKGQADKHIDFMTQKLSKQHPRFPDTSNTRFSSHGNAAAKLLTYITEYKEMMDIIWWSKTNPSLTNIEKNLRHALHDPATLTELCAMVLYQQIVSHPYLRQVRGPGTENVNLLDLGPLHKAVCDHIRCILDDPDILFSNELAFETATLDGQPWHNLLAIEAAIKIMLSLPHVKAITLAFFRGSLTTWIRFSSEFAPGGLIDECSAREKQLVWMPSKNDANEGALGAYCVAVRGKPSLTLQQYNLLAIDEDHTYIMREARKIDCNGLERLRRQEIIDFRLKTAEMHKAKATAAARKALETRRQLRKIAIITRTTDLNDLTIPKIHLQLNALRLRDSSTFPLPHDPAADKEREALVIETAIVEDWGAEEDIEMEE